MDLKNGWQISETDDRLLNVRIVGWSNILDSEIERRKPVEWPHGEIVGTAVVDGKLLYKVVKGIKAVADIEALLVFPVAVLHLDVVTGRVGVDELVSDTEIDSGGFKESGQIPLAAGKLIGKLKAVFRLDTLHPDAQQIPFDHPFEKISKGIGALLRVSS